MSSSYKSTRKQYLVRFGYIGSRFHGLQPQGELPTAGGALRIRLEKAAGERAKALQFAARTDAGVHALCNYATCWFPPQFDTQAFETRLQQLAFEDDGILGVNVTQVPYYVHARANSRGKHYRYTIEDQCTPKSPHNHYAWQIAPTLNPSRMRKAAQYLIGSHNFESLRATGCTANTAYKHISFIQITGPILLPDGRRQFHIDVKANAFVRKMMRNLAGLLAEVGTGLRPPQDAADILLKQTRTAAGITAPPEGLMLMEVGFEVSAEIFQKEN